MSISNGSNFSGRDDLLLSEAEAISDISSSCSDSSCSDSSPTVIADSKNKFSTQPKLRSNLGIGGISTPTEQYSFPSLPVPLLRGKNALENVKNDKISTEKFGVEKICAER